MRRTKIVATLGPASDTSDDIDALIEAGVDVFRLNFSHGTHAEHGRRAELVRTRSEALGRQVGILGDLQGPKIRIDSFVGGKITLTDGQHFTLDTEHDESAGDETIVGCHYKALPEEVQVGSVLILDDGMVVLEVQRIEGTQVHTTVSVGGPLSDKKGINLRGGGLSAPAITEKDRADILFAAQMDCDYLAVSFPRSAEDVELARTLLKAAGGNAGIVAKIERAEAIDEPEIDRIIEASDVIMVARGDLGVEVGDANLPAIQKDLIAKARSANRIVITATQMMESMRYNPVPTRAEVFDVANAVLDGTDAVMLSAETASGKFPVKSVQSMAEICEHAEKSVPSSKHRLNERFHSVDESIALASMYIANHYEVKAIGALTESGNTALIMSRISSEIPIYAVTRHLRTCRRVTLYRGVYPVHFERMLSTSVEANQAVIDILCQQGKVELHDCVVITKGDMFGVGGGTNSMKLVEVGAWLNKKAE